MIAPLLPSPFELAGWAGVGFAALVFIGLGRLLSQGRAAPEIALVAGWGAACLVMTLWGVATALSLRFPAVALAAAGAAGLILPRARLGAAEWRGIGRIVAISLPLLAVMASARPSQPDTFLNILPNAAYLYDHGFFPADGRPLAHSLLPGAPYNLQFAGLMASLVTPGFPPAALVGFNVVLQIAAGLLLARLAAGDEAAPHAAPSWGMAALGLLLATALNPGFVPRFHLSSYGETPVAVALVFAGWLATRRERGTALMLALALAALVEIRQDSVALVVGIVFAAALLPPSAGETRRRVMAKAALAALPAAAIYLAWRIYLWTHFAGDTAELTWMPFAGWQFAALPGVLLQILHIIFEKIVFFGILGATLIAFIARARDGLVAPGMRAAAALLVATAVYNAALLVAYIGHFSGQMTADAHSYFRYNTHLSLLLMAAIVLLARGWIGARLAALPPVWRARLPEAAIAVMLACPAVFLSFLRFDLEPPQQRAWELAHLVAEQIDPADRVALILPGDGNSLSPVLEGLLRFTPPRRPDVALDIVERLGPDTFASLPTDRWAVLSCVPDGFAAAPAGEAALFARDGTAWKLAAHWPYPPAARGRWSQVIAWAPLCLER